MASVWSAVVACLGALVCTRGGLGEVDLGAVYSGAVETAPGGHEWTITSGDIFWTPDNVAIGTPGDFKLKLGPSTLAIGHANQVPLWAVVMPDKPGSLELPSGDRVRVTSVWLRMHPADFLEYASAASFGVWARVDAERRATFAMIEAKRIAAHKLRGSFHIGWRLMVPPLGTAIIDADIAPAGRRFLVIENGTVTHHKAFDTRPLPVDPPITHDVAQRVFDETWSAFDREYAMFGLRPEVDWDALRDEYRPLALAAPTASTAAGVVAMLIAPLRDGHASVTVDGTQVPTFQVNKSPNANLRLLENLVGPLHETQTTLAWAINQDDIGYINIHGLTDAGLVTVFDEVLRTLRDTRGLVIDLRLNGGGNEMIGQKIAGRFLDAGARYSASRWRSGPRRTDLGPLQWRVCPTRGPWRYDAPVAVLIGPRTYSSAESFALMLAEAPTVVSYGAPTAGSSGNPRVLTLPAAIEVALPRWLDVRPDGKPLDGRGVVPNVRVRFDSASGEDAVLSRAMSVLRGGGR